MKQVITIKDNAGDIIDNIMEISMKANVPFLVTVDKEDGLIEKIHFENLRSITATEGDEFKIVAVDGKNQEVNIVATDIEFIGDLRDWAELADVYLKITKANVIPMPDWFKAIKNVNDVQLGLIASDIFNNTLWEQWNINQLHQTVWDHLCYIRTNYVKNYLGDLAIEIWIRGYNFAQALPASAYKESMDDIASKDLLELAVMTFLDKTPMPKTNRLNRGY